jgi:selenocysteine lyase/cysteine desulfurase
MDLLDEAARSVHFPVTRAWTYLDHATFGPFPAAGVAAMAEVGRALSEDVLGRTISTAPLLQSVRERAARLLSCSSEHMALLRSTGEGVGLVAAGLDWRAGDEVIGYERDFPGALAPWRHLADRGVVLRLVPARADHTFSCDDVRRLLSPRTRVVCLSLVQFGSGFRAPIHEIAELCHQRGLWLVVDAAQAVGSVQVDVAALGADIVAAHAYKFLLAGFGLAVCYCSSRAINELRVPQVGWRSAPGAARFEPTIPSLTNLAALDAALGLLLECGMAAVEARIAALTEMIADGLSARGWRVISPRGAGQTSALVSAVHPSLDLEGVRHTLFEHHAVCTVREGFLRISPHVYNTPADVDRLLASLPS